MPQTTRPRPIAPVIHANPAEWSRLIAERANACLPKDGTERAQAPLPLFQSTVANLPDPELWTAGILYVSNESGGAVLAFSDGTDWRRVTDRAIVS